MTDNEIIAAFLGWVRHEPNASYNLPQWYKPDDTDLRKKGTFKGYPEQLKFDKDWSWLMPVVEKIESLGYKFAICRRRVDVVSDNGQNWVVTSAKEQTKCQSVHRAVVEFIKFYNANKGD